VQPLRDFNRLAPSGRPPQIAPKAVQTRTFRAAVVDSADKHGALDFHFVVIPAFAGTT